MELSGNEADSFLVTNSSLSAVFPHPQTVETIFLLNCGFANVASLQTSVAVFTVHSVLHMFGSFLVHQIHNPRENRSQSEEHKSVRRTRITSCFALKIVMFNISDHRYSKLCGTDLTKALSDQSAYIIHISIVEECCVGAVHRVQCSVT